MENNDIDPGNQDSPPVSGLVLPVCCLIVFAILGTVLISVTDSLTRDRIAANQEAQIMKLLAVLLPPNGFDNAPHLDTIQVTDPDLLGSNEVLTVYRARRLGQPVAAILTVIAPTGYVASIRLLVGIDPDGRVVAVRAVKHRETPGLGDAIDADKSEWIYSFNGRTIDDPPISAWQVRRDDGDYDQITGATVTSRAVVTAVRDALIFFAANQEQIFELAEDSTAK